MPAYLSLRRMSDQPKVEAHLQYCGVGCSRESYFCMTVILVHRSIFTFGSLYRLFLSANELSDMNSNTGRYLLAKKLLMQT